MVRLILFLIFATVVAAVATWLANNPGEVAITWQGRVVETSVGILILAVLAFAAVATLLVELARWLGALPKRIRHRRSEANRVRGYQALTTGMVAAAAGNVSRAKQLLRESERLLPHSRPVLLLAAQTAQLEGREEVAHLKFRRMLDAPETELLGLRGLLAQAVKGGDQDEALQLATQAYRRSPTTPWVVQTLFDLMARRERWGDALRLVPELQKLGQLDERAARRQRGLLEHLIGQTLHQEQPAEALSHARRAVKLAPSFAPAAVGAAEIAKGQGRQRLAQKLIASAWRAAPHPELARTFAGLVDGEAPEKRLQRFERRLKPLHPDDPELHVALGELAMAAHQLDDARRHLERATLLEPTSRGFRLLAELERAAGSDQAAVQGWLTKASTARADHAWVCEDTGEVVGAWQPFGTTGRFDAVHWSEPPKVATLIGRDHGPFLVAEGGEVVAEPRHAEPGRAGDAARSPTEMATAS